MGKARRRISRRASNSSEEPHCTKQSSSGNPLSPGGNRVSGWTVDLDAAQQAGLQSAIFMHMGKESETLLKDLKLSFYKILLPLGIGKVKWFRSRDNTFDHIELLPWRDLQALKLQAQLHITSRVQYQSKYFPIKIAARVFLALYYLLSIMVQFAPLRLSLTCFHIRLTQVRAGQEMALPLFI